MWHRVHIPKSVQFSLSQVVSFYTHVAPNGHLSLIDLACLSNPAQVVLCNTISPLGTSDHLGIELSLKVHSTNTCQQSVTRNIWQFENELIAAAKLEELPCDDINESVKLWQETLMAIMNKCVPTKTLGRRRNPPWLTGSIVRHMRKRNLMFQRAKGSNWASDHAKYRQMRNKITALIRSAKRKYFAMWNVSDTRQFWKAYKAIHKEFRSKSGSWWYWG